jgi:hypothetical protein
MGNHCRKASARSIDQSPCSTPERREHNRTPGASAVCCPESSDILDQLGQSQLAIPERFPDAVFDDPAFKVNRLPGRWWQLDTGRIFQHRVSLNYQKGSNFTSQEQ